ncbi:hypothetical protein GCM10009678_27070 [Actinomadura kijaniata]
MLVYAQASRRPATREGERETAPTGEQGARERCTARTGHDRTLKVPGPTDGIAGHPAAW